MTLPSWTFESSYVVLDRDNIDTDQIIPARFLKTTVRDGFGAHAFHDWRYRADGSPDPSFVLNRRDAIGARVLVVGHNFGCGSSREHAVWALRDAGFRAVVSTQFADIFRGNAVANGLLPIEVPRTANEALVSRAGVAARVTVNLDAECLILPSDESVHFSVPAFAKHCLLRGIDEMDFLLDALPDVSRYESTIA